jgi:Flp pilus assembly pilin Flp
MTMSSVFHVDHIVRRLVVNEDGQDLIEYALLSASIGICCVLVWPTIRAAIGAAFVAWDTNVQALSSCTPDPGGGGC